MYPGPLEGHGSDMGPEAGGSSLQDESHQPPPSSSSPASSSPDAHHPLPLPHLDGGAVAAATAALLGYAEPTTTTSSSSPFLQHHGLEHGGTLASGPYVAFPPPPAAAHLGEGGILSPDHGAPSAQNPPRVQPEEPDRSGDSFSYTLLPGSSFPDPYAGLPGRGEHLATTPSNPAATVCDLVAEGHAHAMHQADLHQRAYMSASALHPSDEQTGEEEAPEEEEEEEERMEHQFQRLLQEALRQSHIEPNLFSPEAIKAAAEAMKEALLPSHLYATADGVGPGEEADTASYDPDDGRGFDPTMSQGAHPGFHELAGNQDADMGQQQPGILPQSPFYFAPEHVEQEVFVVAHAPAPASKAGSEVMAPPLPRPQSAGSKRRKSPPKRLTPLGEANAAEKGSLPPAPCGIDAQEALHAAPEDSPASPCKGKRPKILAAVNYACNHCKASHVACEMSRPCTRCIRIGKADTCQDAERKRRGRPAASPGSKKPRRSGSRHRPPRTPKLDVVDRVMMRRSKGEEEEEEDEDGELRNSEEDVAPEPQSHDGREEEATTEEQLFMDIPPPRSDGNQEASTMHGIPEERAAEPILLQEGQQPPLQQVQDVAALLASSVELEQSAALLGGRETSHYAHTPDHDHALEHEHGHGHAHPSTFSLDGIRGLVQPDFSLTLYHDAPPSVGGAEPSFPLALADEHLQAPASLYPDIALAAESVHHEFLLVSAPVQPATPSPGQEEGGRIVPLQAGTPPGQSTLLPVLIYSPLQAVVEGEEEEEGKSAKDEDNDYSEMLPLLPLRPRLSAFCPPLHRRRKDTRPASMRALSAGVTAVESGDHRGGVDLLAAQPSAPGAVGVDDEEEVVHITRPLQRRLPTSLLPPPAPTSKCTRPTTANIRRHKQRTLPPAEAGMQSLVPEAHMAYHAHQLWATAPHAAEVLQHVVAGHGSPVHAAASSLSADVMEAVNALSMFYAPELQEGEGDLALEATTTAVTVHHQERTALVAMDAYAHHEGP